MFIVKHTNKPINPWIGNTGGAMTSVRKEGCNACHTSVLFAPFLVAIFTLHLQRNSVSEHYVE